MIILIWIDFDRDSMIIMKMVHHADLDHWQQHAIESVPTKLLTWIAILIYFDLYFEFHDSMIIMQIPAIGGSMLLN